MSGFEPYGHPPPLSSEVEAAATRLAEIIAQSGEDRQSIPTSDINMPVDTSNYALLQIAQTLTTKWCDDPVRNWRVVYDVNCRHFLAVRRHQRPHQ